MENDGLDCFSQIIPWFFLKTPKGGFYPFSRTIQAFRKNILSETDSGLKKAAKNRLTKTGISGTITTTIHFNFQVTNNFNI